MLKVVQQKDCLSMGYDSIPVLNEAIEESIIGGLSVNYEALYFDYDAEVRICRWINFFNQHYTSCVLMYKKLIEGVLLCAAGNELFLSQSLHEFDISISFFEKILRRKGLLKIEEDKNAQNLIVIALILGQYPGMQLRSVNTAIDLLFDGVNEESLHNVFIHLFVKFQTPCYLTRNIICLSLKEVDFMMFFLQGNNIRFSPDLPWIISKKESYVVNQMLKKQVLDGNYFLERLLACARLIQQSNDGRLLSFFCGASFTFRYSIDDFMKDINFWSEVYGFLLKVERSDGNQSRIQEFLDYFEFMKSYGSTGNYCLKGRTIKSVYEAITEWHTSFDFGALIDTIDTTWRRMGSENSVIVFDKVKYLFSEITSGRALYKESLEMKHCVYSYINYCRYNYLSIWSVKKETHNKMEHYLTIEVSDHGQINQVSRKHNRTPSRQDFLLIKEWGQQEGLETCVSRN